MKKRKENKTKMEVSDDSSAHDHEEMDRALEICSMRPLRPGGILPTSEHFCAAMDERTARGTSFVPRFPGFVKQFRGFCNYCGKQGHKAAECP